jgi:23S rRNA (uracil1939-C5)-methyltransferase
VSVSRCPYFGRCGGCKYDFADPDYRRAKAETLKNFPIDEFVWLPAGNRRRADFAFAGGAVGFYESGTKNIVEILDCQMLDDEIRKIIPQLKQLPASGGALITRCDNGLDIAITSPVPYFSGRLSFDAIRVSWNGRVVSQTAQPTVDFDGRKIDYPAGAFLQPSVAGENAIRDLIAGGGRAIDLFCGLGTWTGKIKGIGYDSYAPAIAAGRAAGLQLNVRDLMKNPIPARAIAKYDLLVMDPPRAGASAQCAEIEKAARGGQKLIYVSCNPASFARDMKILRSWKLEKLTAIDQFPGSEHMELVGVIGK